MAPQRDFEKKIIYPPGVKDITEEISTDDLVRRLKDCATQFQNLNQEDDNSAYIPLALHLANEYFIEHDSKEVRILIACCIADVFRAFAPDAPYKDPIQLKVIFEFFVEQLKGLAKPKQGSDSFKRYHFYLLENFAWVKTFNLCLELEESHAIVLRLFELIFSIISEDHSSKVKKFIIDILVPLINEADNISPELLELILFQIIEPLRSQRRSACMLARDLLAKTATFLEPTIQAFFNSSLILGKTEKNGLACHQYELIYELNSISQTLMVSVLPQLEFKLKSPDTEERLAVTQLLAKLFSEKGSNLAKESKPLWNGFIGRFNDISADVRECIVRSCINFLINHPELHKDMTEYLRQRLHDNDDNVRLETVRTILSAFRKDLNCVNKELLIFLKERALDKKFKVRKEAACGLAQLFRERTKDSISDLRDETYSWIIDKVLHLYYQNNLEDKLLVERLLLTCLVPYKYSLEDKMKRLYHLVATVDDYAYKALRELLRCQTMLRNHMKKIIEKISTNKVGSNNVSVLPLLPTLCRALPDSSKCQEFILRFANELEANHKLRNTMFLILNGENACSEVEHNLRLTLKSFGQPSMNNTYYLTIKQLLERIAPLLIDKQGVLCLVEYIKDSMSESGTIQAELGITGSSQRNMSFLQLLSTMFPAAFKQEKIYESFLMFLQCDEEACVSQTLQILMQISDDIRGRFPEIAEKMIPMLENFVETGNVKQAKYAVYCLNSFVPDKKVFFGNLIENLKNHFTLESQYFRTALVSIGHIAFLCHDMFSVQLKKIVAQVVVKDLLNMDQDLPRGGFNDWGPLETLPDETKVKIAGMKLMVRWLMGLKNTVQPAVSTLRLLITIIEHQGDLMERQHTAPQENSWLRLTAASCVLKLCQEPNYVTSLSVQQFQILATTVHDSCYEVRECFIHKLHKNLINLKLPMEFMALFAFCGIEENKQLKLSAKGYIAHNVLKRRDYLKQNPIPNKKLLLYLPDYVLPYVIYMLAHATFYDNYDDVTSLRKIQDCLWFMMEHLVTKNESYSFSFLKRLLENVKHTQDTQNPEDEEINKKIYAVTDLAMSILLTKVTNIVLRDFPVEPILPSKLFTHLNKDLKNVKTYLPREILNQFSKIAKFELGVFVDAEDTDKTKSKETSASKTFDELAEDDSTRGSSSRNENTNNFIFDKEMDSQDSNDQEFIPGRQRRRKRAGKSAFVRKKSSKVARQASLAEDSEETLLPEDSEETLLPEDSEETLLPENSDAPIREDSEVPIPEDSEVPIPEDSQELSEQIALSDNTSESSEPILQMSKPNRRSKTGTTNLSLKKRITRQTEKEDNQKKSSSEEEDTNHLELSSKKPTRKSSKKSFSFHKKDVIITLEPLALASDGLQSSQEFSSLSNHVSKSSEPVSENLLPNRRSKTDNIDSSRQKRVTRQTQNDKNEEVANVESNVKESSPEKQPRKSNKKSFQKKSSKVSESITLASDSQESSQEVTLSNHISKSSELVTEISRSNKRSKVDITDSLPRKRLTRQNENSENINTVESNGKDLSTEKNLLKSNKKSVQRRSSRTQESLTLSSDSPESSQIAILNHVSPEPISQTLRSSKRSKEDFAESMVKKRATKPTQNENQKNSLSEKKVNNQVLEDKELPSKNLRRKLTKKLDQEEVSNLSESVSLNNDIEESSELSILSVKKLRRKPVKEPHHESILNTLDPVPLINDIEESSELYKLTDSSLKKSKSVSQTSKSTKRSRTESVDSAPTKRVTRQTEPSSVTNNSYSLSNKKTRSKRKT